MKTGKQFIKFGIVGVLNTGVQFAVFVLLFRWLNLPMLIGSGLGYLAGIVNSYFINRFWTFEVKGKRDKREFFRFFMVNIVSMGVNLGSLKLLVEQGSLLPELAQVFAIGSSLVVNFIGNKFWTFRATEELQPEENAVQLQEGTSD